MPDTALDQPFAVCSASDLKEINKKICGNCSLRGQCTNEQKCAAIKVIGTLEAMALSNTDGVFVFLKDLRVAVNDIQKKS